jgi:hypothetical protein
MQKRSKIVIPPGYSRVGPSILDVSQYRKIVEWVVSSGVVGRGIVQRTDASVSREDVPAQVLWELLLSWLRKVEAMEEIMKPWQPAYKCELYFAQADDAMYAKMKFL